MFLTPGCAGDGFEDDVLVLDRLRARLMSSPAMDYAVYGELLQRKGDASRARENLNKAIEIFQECGADGWVKRTEEKLAQM
jgi:hypothetical protein